MKISSLVGRRAKETPRDAELISHQFLLRGGYIKQLSTGIFSMLPLARRIALKIESIIRSEMNAIEGQETTMPVVMPATIWQESGRYEAIGSEMVRFDDRTGSPHVLGMTHEEAVVHMVRSDLTSYRQLPAMVYQIQTKFRDEPRSRGGLIRVREFTMKDAYSFHASQECLVEYYQRCYEAYFRIYNRCGLSNVISVESDSGMMGGKVAHEFMYVNACGEDSLVLCDKCGYRANKEIASTKYSYEVESLASQEEIATPGAATIEELSNFLGITQDRCCKIVLLENVTTKGLVAVLVRGDREINELAVRKALQGAEVKFAEDNLISSHGIVPGYGSVLGVDLSKITLLVDRSILDRPNMVVGANKKDFHVRGWNFRRDLNSGITGEFSFVQEGDCCPACSAAIRLTRGVEVGNIFQLGSKYSASMDACFLDENGKRQPIIMGCYGIGVGRLLACLIEEHHDQWGPIWPMTVAPFHVQICMLDKKKENIEEIGFKLYRDLQAAGVEVLIDDRNEKAGFQFADADLIGIPIRVVLSAKTVSEGLFEMSLRDKSYKGTQPLEGALELICAKVDELMKQAVVNC